MPHKGILAIAALAVLLPVGAAEARDDVRTVYAANGAVIANCFSAAERVVPRGRGRQAWVVRHADYCIRNGGRL
jgi:hypothetical protein